MLRRPGFQGFDARGCQSPAEDAGVESPVASPVPDDCSEDGVVVVASDASSPFLLEDALELELVSAADSELEEEVERALELEEDFDELELEL